MKTIQVQTAQLTGSSYEIGYRLGQMTGSVPPLKAMHTAGMDGFGAAQAAEAAQLFDRWCPGLTEELAGFADALGVQLAQIYYYGMTYLLPRCSQIAVLPGMAADGIPVVARNYEFSHEAEDFCLVKTAVKGKYTHIGTSVLHFGRDDGLNEHGLSVTMSSCGFPVGGLPFMRAPRLKGLQFWAVIRALLENCRDVQEALCYLKGMPVAFNLNLMLLDKGGCLALVETLDGRYAVKELNTHSPEQILWATNHAVLPELTVHEPQVLTHSVQRYEWVKKELQGRNGITREELKDMLLSKYPNGLCCHFYKEFFGTTKSMLISPADGTVELCWGGRAENGWQTYTVDEPLGNRVESVALSMEKASAGTFGFQPR